MPVGATVTCYGKRVVTLSRNQIKNSCSAMCSSEEVTCKHGSLFGEEKMSIESVFTGVDNKAHLVGKRGRLHWHIDEGT